MALLLNIDTATEQAGVCLSRHEHILAIEQTTGQKNHASFVQPAMEKIIKAAGYPLSAIDAVAVTGGPGSYTGLRVGLSTAKGLCYALNKPLIMVNTLKVMALACINWYRQQPGYSQNCFFCPMIDARRMEVFTAVYTEALQTVVPPNAVLLHDAWFAQELNGQKVIFSGSGSHKAKIISHKNAVFSPACYNVENLAPLASLAFNTSNFAHLAYSEPYYLKEFYKKA